MTTHRKYKIVIIEPSPVVQLGIKTLLEYSPDFQVVNCFADYHLFEKEQIDFDLHAILINPTIINLHKPFSVTNLFSKHPEAVLYAIVYNYTNLDTLSSFDGILDIYDSTSLLTKKLTKAIEITHHQTTNTDSNIGLTDREKEILISVAIGLTNKEIAEKHFISVHTVISHRKNISRKIGIKTISGLAIYAIYNNLISEDDL